MILIRVWSGRRWRIAGRSCGVSSGSFVSTRDSVRIVVFEANRLTLGEMPPLKPEWAGGTRNPDDPIFRLRREAGL